MKKRSEFLSENCHFWVVKFSVYLNRLVFVMDSKHESRFCSENLGKNSVLQHDQFVLCDEKEKVCLHEHFFLICS